MNLLALSRDARPPIGLARRANCVRDPADFVSTLVRVAQRVGCERGNACALDRLRGFGASILEGRKRGGTLHRVETRRDHHHREANCDCDRRDDPERQSAAARLRLVAGLADASAYVVKIGHRGSAAPRYLTLHPYSLIFASAPMKPKV